MSVPTGRDVFWWPEFIALADRLGIPMSQATRNVVITIPHNGLVTILHETIAEDTSDPDYSDQVKNREEKVSKAAKELPKEVDPKPLNPLYGGRYA